MDEHNSIIRFLRKDLQLYVFLLVVFFIPLTKEYIPVLMFSWVVVCVIGIYKIKLQLLPNKGLLIFPLAIYILHAIGLLYSSNIGRAMFDLEVKLTSLAIPIAVISIYQNKKINYNLLLQLFVVGNLIASIICLVLAFKNSISLDQTGNIVFEHSVWIDRTNNMNLIEVISYGYSKFSDIYLSKIHHPTYFSMYITFSILILVDFVKKGSKRILNSLLIVYFVVFLWLLGSRAAYLTFIIIFLVFTFSKLIKVRRKWIILVVMCTGLMASVYLMLNSRLSKNVKEVYEIITTDKTLSDDSDIRLWLWKSGYEVFKENVLFGVGTGDIDSELHKKYEQYELQVAAKQNLNAHNQYLDTAIKLGVIGLLVLLSWIITTIFIAVRTKQFLLFYFMLIISINFFFEVILNSIAGVSFVVFFYSLLCARYFRDSSEKI